MGILIGMDEAGYGPNLGPLVVAATAWEAPDEGTGDRRRASDKRSKRCIASAATPSLPGSATTQLASKEVDDDCVDLYRLLRNTVAKKTSQRRIAIADSKTLYHPGLGLRQLERGLHAVLLAMRQSLGCWSAMVGYCGADPDCHHARVCWPDGFDCSLPVDATNDELARLEPRFSKACDGAGVRPLFIRARLVFPEQFNDLVEHYGSKGAALSHITVGLLREVIDAVSPLAAATSAPQSPVPSPQSLTHVVCDKHGGRNYYTSLLQHHFSEHWIAPVFESRAESRYEWGEPESRIRVVFRVHGEEFLPTALASMTAKYLRELAMRAFNEFWRSHIPDLRPTAGYSGDSRRFKKDIAAKQRDLGIDDHVLWRSR